MKIKESTKLNIYKILLFVFAFVLAFMPQTASRNLEVNSRVVVEMLGIDGKEGEVSMTAQFATPSEAENAATKDTVTVEAKTVTQAIELLNTALGRRAELGQCSVLVLGSELDTELLGVLLTATDVTADVYLAAAKEKASDLVGDLTDFMKKSGVTDADFIAYSAKRAHVATTTLLGFMSKLKSPSDTAFVPLVEPIEEEGESSGGSGGQSGSGQNGGGKSESGGQSEKGEVKGMKVEKLALYNGSGRATVLDSDAARGVAWVSAPIEKSILTADIEYNGETFENVSARLISKKSKIEVDAKTHTVNVNVKVSVEPNCEKYNTLTALGDPRAAIKKGFADKIEKDIRSAHDKGMGAGCDPLFIDREFFRRFPDYFEKGYDREDTTLVFDVEVHIN